jgi:dihydroneopterin aldolase
MEIQIEGLTVAVRIGVHPWEQAIVQQLLIDLTCPCPDTAGKVDILVTTLDYSTVATAIKNFVADQSWQLLETLHRDLALFLHQEFALSKLYLRIEKPFALRQARRVALVGHYHFESEAP